MNKTFILPIVQIMLLIPVLCIAEDFKATGNIEVTFSPRGAATDTIVEEINSAKSEILLQAYLFTSEAITKALVDARKRGVRIEAILDKSQGSDRGTLVDIISKTEIPVYIDLDHGIAHNKVIIIDRKVLITGSFDFSKAEENNVENMMVLKGNKLLVDKYIKYFDEHKGHSVGHQAK